MDADYKHGDITERVMGAAYEVYNTVVEDKVKVEVKAAGALEKAHEAQLINYLKATGVEVGLLINFGPKIQIKRRLFDQ